MKKLGLIVIVAGAVIAALAGFSFFTRDKVVDMGNLDITTNKRHDLEWSPIVGLVTVAAGAGLYFMGTHRTSQSHLVKLPDVSSENSPPKDSPPPKDNTPLKDSTKYLPPFF